MEQQAAMRFNNVSFSDWGYVDPQGVFRIKDDDREASRYPTYGTCKIDGKIVAVFVNQELSKMDRARIVSARPDWLDVMVFVDVTSDSFAKTAIIRAEIGYPANVESAMCAFAAACIAFGEGHFRVIPERYLVHVDGRDSIELIVKFDWDSETWSGLACHGQMSNHDSHGP